MATPSTSILPLTDNIFLDVSLNGFYWQLGPDRVITWSLSNGLRGETWNNSSAFTTVFDELFTQLEGYINVDFQYVGFFDDPQSAYLGGADINISLDSHYVMFPEPEPGSNKEYLARGIFPDQENNFIFYSGAPGDIYVNLNSSANTYSSWEQGSSGWFLLLHEIGHVLGLKHSFDDYHGYSLDSLGLSAFEVDWFTVMSYSDDYPFTQILWEPATYMALDILGLQYLYGPNLTTNLQSGNYELGIINSYVTIWDAGGNDGIDVSNSNQGWIISLPYDIDHDYRTAPIGDALPSSDGVRFENGLSPLNLYWLIGDIENVVGSAYADSISGNALNNELYGNGGNDYIEAGAGNDLLEGGSGLDDLYGGDGTDIALYQGKYSDAAIASDGNGGYYVFDLNVEDGSYGIDLIYEIEILVYQDRNVLLHLDSEDLLFHHNGHTYRFVATALTWEEARQYAESHGAHLAVISSYEENQAIYEYLSQFSLPTYSPLAYDGGDAAYVWIGGSDYQEEGQWVWVDGSSLDSYSNWGVGAGGEEPDNYLDAQDALAMAVQAWPHPDGGIGEPGQWNDLDELNVQYFIVEWDEYIPINYDPEGLILLHGDANPGNTLFAEVGSISDQNGLGTFNFQWLRDGEIIDGATGQNYQITSEDLGTLLTVSMNYEDGEGFDETITSEARLPTEPTSDSYTDLIEMYVIILGRAPAQGGLNFWSGFINQGKDFEYIASEMWNSDGAREFYPIDMSTEEVVTSVYINILVREPKEAGLNYWVGRWDDNGPVDTMLEMIGALTANNSSDPLAIADKVLFQAKVDIGGYLANTVMNTDVDLASAAYDYLEDGFSVEETKNFIDTEMGIIGQASELNSDDLFA